MYKFDPRQPVGDEFRKIALSQIDEALADLAKGDGGDGDRSAVHEARRRCKKLRALLRLVRPGFADFGMENAALRDAAGLLSHLRDAEVLQHTVKDLSKWRASEALERIAARLAGAAPAHPPEPLDAFAARLNDIRARVPAWALRKNGYEALIPGLRLTLRAARHSMRQAAESRTAIDFHEWRKATKTHGFHLDLLRRAAPDLLPADLEAVDRLSLLLGEHHDLALLEVAVAKDPQAFGDDADLVVLADSVATRRSEIESAALVLGRQIFAETPRAAARRFATYWKDVS